jgi:hypothetical protein
MNARTVRDFDSTQDVLAVVDRWAGRYGYRLKGEHGASRLYQKGTGFLVAPMMLEIGQRGTGVHLEAWIRANLFVRICALFMLPAEMGVESGGFRGVAPRKIARGAVNQLLADLGQPPIP